MNGLGCGGLEFRFEEQGFLGLPSRSQTELQSSRADGRCSGFGFRISSVSMYVVTSEKNKTACLKYAVLDHICYFTCVPRVPYHTYLGTKVKVTLQEASPAWVYTA